MSKVTYEIIKKDDRLFFHDGKKYVLFDSGFTMQPKKSSVSVDGTIGPFSANIMPQSFFASFIDLVMDDGKSVDAVFNPMDGCNCLIEGNKLTIADEEIACPNHAYFFDFVHPSLPIIEGEIEGRSGLFFFDSGARMTMFCDRSLASKPLRSYREWMAMLHTYEELSVHSLELAFPNGFRRRCEGALVTDPQYSMAAAAMDIRAVLGIDIVRQYDLFFAANMKRRGIALIERRRAA